MKKEYEVGSDDLVLKGYPINYANVSVKITAGSSGVIKRGQVLDRNEDGEYELHKAEGIANCIVESDTEYGKTDDSVIVTVFTTGPFRKTALVSDVELTDADTETLRDVGIILG